MRGRPFNREEEYDGTDSQLAPLSQVRRRLESRYLRSVIRHELFTALAVKATKIP